MTAEKGDIGGLMYKVIDELGVPLDENEKLPMKLASQIEARRVEYLVPNMIPRAMLTLIFGHPGDGKTTVALDIAARLSTAAMFPNGDSPPLAKVLYVSAEDSPSYTLRPRLERQDADLDMIAIIDLAELAVQNRYLTLLDIDLIEQAIADHGADILIVDPVLAFMGAVSAIDNVKVRRVLTGLSLLAERANIAIVGIMHPNKRSNESRAMNRLSGALDFAAAARSILVVGRDPETLSDRYVVSIKNSNGPVPDPWKFHFAEDGTLIWDGVVPGMDAERLLAGPSPKRTSEKRDQAEAFLLDALAGGAMPVKTLKGEAEAVGLSWRTVYRAKDRLGINRDERTIFKDGSGAWMWCLPVRMEDSQIPIDGSGEHPAGQHQDADTALVEDRSTADSKSASVSTVANFGPGTDSNTEFVEERL